MAMTVVGMFDDLTQAHDAVNRLVDAGFARGDVSVLRGQAPIKHTSVTPDFGMASAGAADSAGSDQVLEAEMDVDTVFPADHLGASAGAAAGAGTGAVIGAGAGLLTSAAGLFIPGLGPILGIGPIAATILGGAGIGAVAGGLSGALVNSGVPEDEAAHYTEGVRRGGTLVSVKADDDKAETAADVLEAAGAYDLDERRAAWTDVPAGGNTTASAISTLPDSSLTTDVSVDPAPGEQDWAMAEPAARRHWERANPGTPWDSVKETARATWEKTKVAADRE